MSLSKGQMAVEGKTLRKKGFKMTVHRSSAN